MQSLYISYDIVDDLNIEQSLEITAEMFAHHPLFCLESPLHIALYNRLTSALMLTDLPEDLGKITLLTSGTEALLSLPIEVTDALQGHQIDLDLVIISALESLSNGRLWELCQLECAALGACIEAPSSVFQLLCVMQQTLIETCDDMLRTWVDPRSSKYMRGKLYIYGSAIAARNTHKQ